MDIATLKKNYVVWYIIALPADYATMHLVADCVNYVSYKYLYVTQNDANR
jgi:hypothetical protein